MGSFAGFSLLRFRPLLGVTRNLAAPPLTRGHVSSSLHPMSAEALLGLVLGGGLGLVNAGASVALYRIAIARTHRDGTFYKIVLGGMLVRMWIMLAAVALAIWLVPVDISAFIGALLGAFVLGLIVEIAVMVRGPS